MIPDWQMNVLNKLQGVKKGELMLTVGRRSGKSMLGSLAFQRLWDDLHSRPVERLVLSEGTVYGSRYYCVEPYGGSWLEMEKWVLKTCGESTGSIWAEEKYKHAAQPGERWYGNNRKFWFRDEQDRIMFVLKWR
jgi:hypothetical protein